jgi:hypothetical protein
MAPLSASAPCLKSKVQAACNEHLRTGGDVNISAVAGMLRPVLFSAPHHTHDLPHCACIPTTGGVCHTLEDIANPASAADGLFMIAIFDRKVNNYECCPTFSFPIGGLLWVGGHRRLLSLSGLEH